jgi:hypothetical protein
MHPSITLYTHAKSLYLVRPARTCAVIDSASSWNLGFPAGKCTVNADPPLSSENVKEVFAGIQLQSAMQLNLVNVI